MAEQKSGNTSLRITGALIPIYLLIALLLLILAPPSVAAFGIILATAAALSLALMQAHRLRRQLNGEREARESLEESQQKLTEAVKRSQRLISVVSHDVRSPLGSVVQLLDFVEERREQFSPEELAQITDDITVSIRNSYQLLDNLVSWARSVSDSVEVRPRAWHLDELIQSALSPVFLASRRKGIYLLREFDLGLEVRVDRQMLEASLRNIISNAVKFTPTGGSVLIRCGYAFEEGIVIEVRDTGVGMEPKELERLLEPGSNAVSRIGTSGERGSGVGFEVAREFVQLNEGRIEVESTPGSGTSVRIFLPGGYNPEYATLAAAEEQLPAVGRASGPAEPEASDQ
ncbi:MAG: sensor histidine kinase [Spirochaetaceae bacterium]